MGEDCCDNREMEIQEATQDEVVASLEEIESENDESDTILIAGSSDQE